MISDLSKLLRAIREQVNPVGKPAAVVFNCHITGLEVVRSLGKRGIPTIGLDQDESAYGLHSRYTTVAGECPYPLKDERGFIDLLLEIGSTLTQRAVLFPCLDEWVFAVARHRSELERFFILPFSDIDIIERILDKNLLYRKCEERGIPIPRTYYVDDQTPEQIAREIDFPCIVKPALQREFTNEFGEKVFHFIGFVSQQCKEIKRKTPFLDLAWLLRSTGAMRPELHLKMPPCIPAPSLDATTGWSGHFLTRCTYFGHPEPNDGSDRHQNRVLFAFPRHGMFPAFGA